MLELVKSRRARKKRKMQTMDANGAASQWNSNKSIQKSCYRVTSRALNQIKQITNGNAALKQGSLKAIVATSQEIVCDREKTGPLVPVQTGSMATENWFPVPSNQSSTGGELLFLMPPSRRLAARSLRAQIKFKSKSQCEQTQRCQGMKASCQPTKAKWVHQRRGRCLFASSK